MGKRLVIALVSLLLIPIQAQVAFSVGPQTLSCGTYQIASNKIISGVKFPKGSYQINTFGISCKKVMGSKGLFTKFLKLKSKDPLPQPWRFSAGPSSVRKFTSGSAINFRVELIAQTTEVVSKPAKDVSKSPSISDPQIFVSNDLCKIKDLSFRPDVSNGFPRPAGVLANKSKAVILVLPVSFPDQVFGDDDLVKLRRVLTPIEEFYKKTSYGKFTLTFEIPDKRLWVMMERSAESFNLIKWVPQTDSISIVEQIFQTSNQEINFDAYDGVVLETKSFTATAGGQAFAGREFRTSHGTAKRVSFEWGNAAGQSGVIAHELAHSLFGLEDLYIYLNSSRPSVPDPVPAGPWDMMSVSSENFFGWSKYLIGWLDDLDVNCVVNQNSVTQYISEIDNFEPGKKLLMFQSAPGILLNAEVRRSNSCGIKEKCLGLLIYTVDTNLNNGDGPIKASKVLLYTNETLTTNGYQFKVDDFDDKGLLVTVTKSNN